MHILLGLISLITLAAVWYWRIRMISRAASDGYRLAKGVANRPRRIQERNGTRKQSLKAVNDPREAATVMMLEVARSAGPLTKAHENAIMIEMRVNFGLSETDAEALYAKAGQLSRQAPAPHAVIARMSEVVINSPGMGPKEFDDVCAMLENVAVADGEVTTIERDLIQIWRRKAGLN